MAAASFFPVHIFKVSLQKFKKGCKVSDNHLLRSFFTVKFCRDTLKMCTGKKDAAAMDQLLQVLVKTLVLHEMMLRQIPLDKRAYSVPALGEWEFYEEKVSAGVDRYFTMLSKALEQLNKATSPEGVSLETCDLFDGRLYRHLFHVLVKQGISTKGKIAEDFFQFTPYVKEELDALWKEAGSKDKFFPVDMASLLSFPGLEPPGMPEQLKPRPKPAVQPNTNEFLETLWKEFPFSTITQDVEVT